ncbi:hypothetical protein WOLCODRAFT_101952 [Wolfiporia cocos MD-104 SS10]|uniref:Alcohol acetyltransferase n=1 Tax=Wolfiporia cocos (strain MD-104) TaxID=742152 RepID=A0A2H3JLD5_WOLCO|nr:hypothetical protein WOLCODRAFT_101952 [Wolfiporia cocos MD-104 SS10]
MSRTVRQAGLLERYYVARHDLGMFFCVVVSAKYTAPDGGVLPRAGLFRALAQVAKQHGALAVRLVRLPDGRHAFERLSEIDLSQVVEFRTSGARTLAQTLQEQITRGFDTDSALPLWRLQVLEDNTINFAWHHGIGDGQSGFAFHHALQSALNDLDDDPNHHRSFDETTLISPDAISLASPIEERNSLSVPLGKLFHEVFNLLCPQSWTPSHTAWTGAPVPATESLLARVHLLQYTAMEVSRMLEICRKHNTTLTALVHTLAVVVISRLLAADRSIAMRYSTLSTNIPVSLRPLIDCGADEFGNYISSYQHHPAIIPFDQSAEPGSSWTEHFPWDSATRLAAELRLQQTQSASKIGLLRYLWSYEAYLTGMLGKKRSVLLEVSNLGRYPFIPPPSKNPVPPQWNVSDMYFTMSNPSSGPAMHADMIGTPNGGLGITIAWGKDVVEDSFGESFYSGLRDAMAELVEE